MAVSNAPANFQGDLIDPLTGNQVYRVPAWWESRVSPSPATPRPSTAPAPASPSDPTPPSMIGGWDPVYGFLMRPVT